MAAEIRINFKTVSIFAFSTIACVFIGLRYVIKGQQITPISTDALTDDDQVRLDTGLGNYFLLSRNESYIEQVLPIYPCGSTNGPSTCSPPPHITHYWKTEYQVIHGTLGIMMDTNSTSINMFVDEKQAGESVVVPQGSIHTIWNAGDDDLKVKIEWENGDASNRTFYDFVQQLTGVLRDHGGNPFPVKLMVLLDDFGIEPCLPWPVWALLRRTLLPLARFSGYRSNYEEYMWRHWDVVKHPNQVREKEKEKIRDRKAKENFAFHGGDSADYEL